jgi:hypothetical protein
MAQTRNTSCFVFVRIVLPPHFSDHGFRKSSSSAAARVEDLTSGSPVAVWADAPTRVGPGEPRVLRIVLPQPRTISALRVVSAPRAVQAYPEVDAEGLVPAAARAGEAPKE